MTKWKILSRFFLHTRHCQRILVWLCPYGAVSTARTQEHLWRSRDGIRFQYSWSLFMLRRCLSIFYVGLYQTFLKLNELSCFCRVAGKNCFVFSFGKSLTGSWKINDFLLASFSRSVLLGDYYLNSVGSELIRILVTLWACGVEGIYPFIIFDENSRPILQYFRFIWFFFTLSSFKVVFLDFLGREQPLLFRNRAIWGIWEERDLPLFYVW